MILVSSAKLNEALSNGGRPITNANCSEVVLQSIIHNSLEEDIEEDAIINNLKNVSCDCPRPCAFFRYDMTISSSQLPSRASSQFILNQLDMKQDLQRLRDNYIEVRVYLGSNIVREETHEPQYTFTSMLAYLGGQMGFFLGASLVTLTEFFETLILFFYLFFKRKIVEMGKMEPQPSVSTEEEKKKPEQGKY
ncbi:acid-sensing ion channel 4 [Elysia marginata]|uniref:Acid-sensing ion channel 4 n=1 Tax=Elysia marginata TaxID=1093978 RepID=A0AAV4FB81_9GAST|nr:acid-sensing ion channel 4 [Elysia marginata]